MSIDFVVVFGDQSEGREIATATKAAGYNAQVVKDENGDLICYCTKTMVATYEAVVAAKSELDGLVSPLGGEVDGWETAGNGDGEPYSTVAENPHFLQFGGRGGW